MKFTDGYLELENDESLSDVDLEDNEKEKISTLVFSCSEKDSHFIYEYPNLKKVVLTEKNKIVPYEMFSRNFLKKVEFGIDSQIINSYAFAENDLRQVRFGKNLHTIMPYAFLNNRISKLDIESDTIKIIGKNAFAGNCFEELTLNNIQTIDSSAFSDNEYLKKVTLKNVSLVENSVFAKCENIIHFEFDTKSFINPVSLHENCKIVINENDKSYEFNCKDFTSLYVLYNKVYIISQNILYIFSDGQFEQYNAKGWSFNIHTMNFLKSFLQYNKTHTKKAFLPDYSFVMTIGNEKEMDNYFSSFSTFMKLFNKTGLDKIHLSSFYLFCNKLGLFCYTNQQEEAQNYKIRARVCDFVRELKENNFNFSLIIKYVTYFIGRNEPEYSEIFMKNYKEFFNNDGLLKHFFANYNKIAENKKNKFGKKLIVNFDDIYNDYMQDTVWIDPKYKPIALELKRYLTGNANYEECFKKAIELIEIATEIVNAYKTNETKDYFCFAKDKQIDKDFTYMFMEKNDPRILSVAHDCDCCSKLAYVGEAILEEIMTTEEYGLLVIKDKMGKIIAKSTLYLSLGDGMCYANNFEVNRMFLGDVANKIKGYASQEEKIDLYKTFKRAFNEYLKEFNSHYPETPLKEVWVGNQYNKLLEFLFGDNLEFKTDKIFNLKFGNSDITNYECQFKIADANKKVGDLNF